MKQSFFKISFIIALGFVLSALLMPSLSADENTSQASDIVDMIVGDIQTVTVDNLTRVSVTNPEVADISDAQSDKIIILAKKAGETVLFVWDTTGERSIKVRVVNEDLSAVKARVQKVLDEANIKGVSLEENLDVGRVVVSGTLSKDDKARLSDILQPYSDNLLSFVKEEKNEDLIQVDMEIVEISTTYEESLGIQWGNGSSTTSSSSSSSSSSGSSSGGTGGLVTETENIPSTNGNGKIGDFFKIGSFARTNLQATINALVSSGKAKLISKPRLVVVSGKQASFLVGGEIPIQNTTTNTVGTSQTSSTTYSQYGVNLMVTPTIREGKIDVQLNVDIRDVDSSTPISGGGSSVAFITRTASTDLFMDNKQTIVLAGLIKYENAVTYTEIPFLSKIPLVGLFFRYKDIPGNTGTEMVIVLTPMVLTNKIFADKEVVMPTPVEQKTWDEAIESKFPHEPMSSWPVVVPKVAPVAKDQSSYRSLMEVYARMVQEKISKAISYPNTASGIALTGTVKLKLHILKDGSLDSEEVMESSGNSILDQDAMQAAKTAAPFDAFATGMDQEGIVFTIPIVYNNLISGGTQAPPEKGIASY